MIKFEEYLTKMQRMRTMSVKELFAEHGLLSKYLQEERQAKLHTVQLEAALPLLRMMRMGWLATTEDLDVADVVQLCDLLTLYMFTIGFVHLGIALACAQDADSKPHVTKLAVVHLWRGDELRAADVMIVDADPMVLMALVLGFSILTCVMLEQLVMFSASARRNWRKQMKANETFDALAPARKVRHHFKDAPPIHADDRGIDCAVHARENAKANERYRGSLRCSEKAQVRKRSQQPLQVC